jgi:hypothetical protein
VLLGAAALGVAALLRDALDSGRPAMAADVSTAQTLRARLVTLAAGAARDPN